MFPTIGRIVIYHQPKSEEPVNGSRDHPAIITRVWSETGVNLQVFFDAGVAQPRTSVCRDDIGGGCGYWTWPQIGPK
jgi:hypothetical protein